MAIDNNEQLIEEAKVPTMRSLKSRRLVLVVAVLSLLGVVFFIYVFSVLLKMLAENLFREYVVNPIPESVAKIKVDQPKSRGGYGYVFRFNVNREDFERIRESRPLRDVENLDYKYGTGLLWEWKDWVSTEQSGDRGTGFSMYALVRKPSWYDLPSWENPEAYALRQADVNNHRDIRDIQVLLYNNDRGQAYFITFYYDGRGL